VDLVRTDVLEEHIASIIRVTRISKVGTALAVTDNQSILPTSQKMVFFIVITMKTSNLT
jgi:hypothetical protein